MKVSSITTAAGSIPKLGVGTWRLSGEACKDLVAAAIGLGYRHVDTAAMYDNEDEVGAGLRASGVDRSEIFLTTKVWSDNIGDGDLQRSAERSLQRLGVDQVDLLLIHWPNPAIAIEESIRALCEVKERGLTRAIGVSNFPSALLDRATALATEPLMCNQVEYHPYLTQKTVLAACRNHDMAVTAYCPIARGKVNDDPVIKAIADRLGATPVQVTLAWLLGQDKVAAIPKTAKVERLAENLAAVDLDLSDEEMAQISALGSPSGRMVEVGSPPRWDPE